MKIVFDIDGTICFNGQFIDSNIIKLIQQLENHGHQIIFASARPIRDLLPVLPNIFHQHTLIGGNGSIISQNGQIQVVQSIEAQHFAQIKQLINEYDLDYIVDDSWDYAAHLDSQNVIYSRLDPLHTAKHIDISTIETPIKVILLNIDAELMPTILQQLSSHQDNLEIIHHSDEFNIDITAKSINKYSALQYLFGSDVQYIAFGNDHNDIAMLNHAQQAFYVAPFANHQQLTQQYPNYHYIDANNEAIIQQLQKPPLN